MGDAHETLSYVISADDKASAVFRGVGAEITKLSNLAGSGLSNIARDMGGLGAKKPLEFVKADQALVLAKTEAEMAKLNKAMAASGVATKLESAEMDLLAQRHKVAQREIDKTAASHTGLTKAATAASYGILAAEAAIIYGAVKQGVAWEDLGKKIQQETGLSGQSLKGLMATINNVTGTVPYKLNEVSAAAVLLKTKFGLTDPQIEKTAGLMVGFAQRVGEETKPALTGLSGIMQDYRQPLGDVVGLTDKLTSVSQATQKPMGELLNVVERYGPKLQAMGFGLNESIQLLGIFQESGITTTQMGRGLSQALTTAEKDLGVTAANPHGNPQEALAKEETALRKAEDAVLKYNETIPKTVTQQNQLDRERVLATEHLDVERRKTEELKKAIDKEGGSHATVASIIKGEIGEIEHAKSSQEAYSIALADFGKQTGPSFARAFYNNQTAIKAVDKALGEHGATQRLVTAEEGTLGGQLTKVDEEWHKTERTLSTVLMPALGFFLKMIREGTEDVEKFVQGNASLAETLGAGVMAGSGGYLIDKALGGHVAKAVGGGASSVFSKITGIGSSAAGSELTGLHGMLGTTAMVGSRTNPVATYNVGGTGGGLPGGGTAEKDAAKSGEEASANVLERFAEKHPYIAAGGTAAAGAGVGAGILFGSADAFRAAAELIHPGTAKQHSLGEVESLAPGSSAEVERLKAAAAAPLHTELRGVAVPDAHKFVENTEEEVAANKLLLNSSEKIQEAEEELATMRRQGETHTEAYRATLKNLAAAEAEHAQGLSSMAAAEARHAEAMRQQVEGNITQLDAVLRAHPSSSVRAAVLSNYNELVSDIGGAMQKGYISVSQGTADINKALLAEAKVLGISPGQISSGIAGAAKGAGAIGSAVNSGIGSLGAATGARVPGPVGPDNWTLVDPSGRAAAKVGGAELLIANRHTEADASRATMAVYGKTLGEMVAGERTPHSAATGGRFVPDPGTNFAVGKEPLIAADLQKLAEQQAWTVYGISGYRTPQQSVAVGGFANDPHTRGEAADVGINSQLLSSAAALNAAMLAAVGLERPFYPASPHEINHVQLLGSGVAGGARGAVAEAKAAAGAIAAIRSPKWSGPGGALGSIGRGALSKIAGAANERLSQLEGGATAGGIGGLSGFHGGGSPSANEQLGRQMMLAAGWGAGEWPALQALWTQESGWNANAVNLSSGAYGIPQSLGHGHPYNLGEAAPQIAWGLNYIKGRYGTPSAAEAHEEAFHWYEKGGRLDYAGEFGSGGFVTASRPTLAMFGDNGTETAVFLPHAGTGIRVGASGLGETEGVNPNTGDVEYHTQEEWQQIRLQHSSQAKKEALYKKAHPGKAAKPTYEDEVRIGGLGAGMVTLPEAGAVNLDTAKGISEISTATWAKVVAAIEKTLKSTSDDRVALGITGRLSEEHGARSHALATKAIEASSKTVMGVLKNAPEEEGIAAGNQAQAALKKLMADAKRSGNQGLVKGLQHDLEVTFKTTASRIVKTAEAAPAGRASGADSAAVGQLWMLASKARKDNEGTVEQALLKDAQKTVIGWHSAIGTAFTKAQKMTTTGEDLKIAKATLDTIHKAGAGARIKASAQTDPQYLKEEEANAAKAEKEYEAERVEIHKLMAQEAVEIKKLQAKETKERKRHHLGAANSIEANIRLMEAQLGEAREQYNEVTTAIQETKINVAELQAEHEKAVETALKEQIDEANTIFESKLSNMQLSESLAEGQLHREGKDVSGLEEDKTKQEGVLTPTQIAQANQDYAAYKQHHEEQIREEEHQRSYDESQLGGLSGEDRTSMEKTIAGLTGEINNLMNQIYDQGKATEKLTEATEANTKQYGGVVGVEFNGQNYVVGGSNSMSSNSGADIGVGI